MLQILYPERSNILGSKPGKIKKSGKNLSEPVLLTGEKRALSQSLTRAISDSDEFRECDFSWIRNKSNSSFCSLANHGPITNKHDSYHIHLVFTAVWNRPEMDKNGQKWIIFSWLSSDSRNYAHFHSQAEFRIDAS